MHAAYSPHDYTLVLLLTRYRAPDPERVRAALLHASKRAITAAASVVEQGLCSGEEAQGYEEASRYLIAGGLLGNCPRCLVQIVAPSGRVEGCPRCRGALVSGILPAPTRVEFDPALEEQVRRIIDHRVAETRAREQVAQAEQMRRDGRLATRPESELAPADRARPAGPLGHYDLEALIGRGRHTYVYRGKDRRTGRPVAVKVVHAHPGEPESSLQPKIDRLQRESDYARAVDHPNVIQCGPLEQEGPWHYLSMTHADGPTMEDVLAARKLGGSVLVGQARLADLRALCTAVCEVAEGLHHAHLRGVIHRDVWSRNVLFSRSGHAYLGDFGNARRLGGESPFDNAPQPVRPHVPPERIRSERQALGRSDVYGLGALLYEIVTGRPPYLDPTPEAMAQRILNEPPPAPRAVNGDVSPELEAVILRAMERDPVRRFPSAQDFGEALALALPPAAEDLDAPSREARGVRAVRWVADPVRAVWERFDYFAHRRGYWFLRVLESTVAFLLGYFLLAGVAAVPEPDPTLPLRPVEAAWTALFASKGFDYDLRRQTLQDAVSAAGRTLAEAHPGMQLAFGRWAWSQGDAARAERHLAAAMTDPAYRIPGRLAHGIACFGLAERERDPRRADALRKAAKDDFLVVFSAATDPYERRLAEGMMRLDSGEYEAAYAMFHTLAGERPTRPEAFVLEVYALRRAGKPREAVASARQAEATQPNLPYLGLFAAEAAWAAGDFDAARESAAILLKRWPGLAEALRLEAVALLARNDPAGALDRADRALRVDPEFNEAHRLRALALAAEGRVCEAIDVLAQRLEAGVTDGEFFFERGRLYLQHGDRARGEADLRAYVDALPQGRRAAEARELLEKR